MARSQNLKNLPLRFACYITGRNYHFIVTECSEASVISVKKYFGAILIVVIIWAFIGFTFTQRYVQGSVWTSIFVAAIMVIIVIQIERQIILTIGKNNWARFLRGLIGFIMAVIGSIIIDQMLFKEDVEKKKISNIQEEVNSILPYKTQQIDNEIAALDTLIARKEKERTEIINDVAAKPFIKSAKSEVKTIPIKTKDATTGTEKDTLVHVTNYTLTDVPNPKAELIPQIDNHIANLRAEKAAKENARLTIRQDLENELKSKTGFLDELIVLLSVLRSHWMAWAVWIIIVVFFLLLELFVLVNKWELWDDYDELVLKQMESNKRRIYMRSKGYSEQEKNFTHNLVC
jgi:hypothetical protein